MPRGPRQLAVTFGAENLTHYGGVYLVHRFLSRLGFKDAIAQHIRVKQRNNRYSIGEMLMALLYPMILGLERLETTQLLRQNGVFQYLTGLPSYPDATSLRRFLLRAAPAMLPRPRTLHDQFLRRMTNRPHALTRLIFDVDSTVLVLYGKQEGARVGYNLIKRGRPSYHPLLCFEGQSKDYWHGELRPGDVHTARGTRDLLAACFAKRTDPRQRVIVRADKGFYDGALVTWLEEQRAYFVIVAKLTAPIKRKLSALRYSVVAAGALAQTDLAERFRSMSRQAETRGLAEPFKGVTTSGEPVRGLFPLRSTGVSTEPVRRSAESLLRSLNAEQRARTAFSIDDHEWRKWMNQHFYVRQGVSFEEMSEPQRAAALELLRASLSAKGLELSRDIMKLNHTLGELNNDNFAEYGEWLYWITIMGEPSATQPWGWQLDGHHLIINYFVLGDQVVMTPLFVGSEPVSAASGKYQGTAILQQEQSDGLRLYVALTPEQQQQAVIQLAKAGNNNLGEAFKDNLILDYAGVAAKTFTDSQKRQLLDLIRLYVDNMKEDHARVRMEEVAAHIDDTYFAWIGGAGDDAVFYYRIHSPVVLIEFDHQSPANLRHLMKPGVPNRQHIHVVVRTPNGNDYGKDLLRQHYEKQSHPH